MAKKTINVEGTAITLLTIGEDDFISLTDIDQRFEGGGRHIENWIRNQNTIEYLTTWETLHNPNFNSMQLHGIKEQVGLNRFLLSVKKWVELTSAIGLRSSAGRYGGTYAHLDIAFHFCLWLSPTFQLYIAKEFQRLKKEEAKESKEALDWNLKRTLAKVNYRVHAEAVREYLMPPQLVNTKKEGMVFASEADLLNVAVFGMTAKEWKMQNPEAKGNMRDHASTEQLIILANLESLNAKLLEWDCDQEQRLEILNKTAIDQMNVLLGLPAVKELKAGMKLDEELE